MAFDLTPTGMTIETIAEIDTAIKDGLRAWQPKLQLDDRSALGVLVGILAERENKIQLKARDVHQAFTPAGASGYSLRQLALLTGTKARSRDKTLVAATVHLNAGTPLLAGVQARVPGNLPATFELVTGVINGGGSPADVPAVFRCLTAGTIYANAGTLTEIVTPVSGWVSVTNALDATPGRDDESDPDLRLRREQELRVQGSAQLQAIVANVREVAGVIDARGVENTDDAPITIQGITLPAHSYLIVIWDGTVPAADDDAIAQAIWDKGVVGIASTAATAASPAAGTATDAAGNAQTVAFARAEVLSLDLSYTVEYDATLYPVTGDADMAAAVATYLNRLWTIGSDAYWSRAAPAVFGISGVISLDGSTGALHGDSLTTTPIKPNITQIARADSGQIVVFSTAAADGP